VGVRPAQALLEHLATGAPEAQQAHAAWQDSVTAFHRRAAKRFPAFRDVALPFGAAVRQLQHGLALAALAASALDAGPAAGLSAAVEYPLPVCSTDVAGELHACIHPPPLLPTYPPTKQPNNPLHRPPTHFPTHLHLQPTSPPRAPPPTPPPHPHTVRVPR
jgi:hypothetical protein